MKQFIKDKLSVRIYDTRAEMGSAAAKDIADCIKAQLAKKDKINMIFAAAPSQNEVLAALCADTTIEWNRINAFHMDEYIGISPEHPAGFAMFLRRALFDKVPFASVNYIDCTAEAKAEAERYSELLKANPVDIVCMGIGENGHIAFNDPHVADFNDPLAVKVVDLDETCRMQQVHDGCFASLDEVPKYALTLTCPTLMSAKYRFCVVPAATKANAVKNTVEGPIGEACPATSLRIADNSVLYCDADSAALIGGTKMKFKLTFITDEVSQELDEVVAFAKHFGITALELRSVEGKSPFQFDDALVDKIKAVITENGMTVPVLSAPLFKCDINDDAAYKEHIESFERLAGYAVKLGAKYIRGFDFFDIGASLEARAAKFAPIIEICRKYGVTVLIEYDPTLHASTPEKVAEIVNFINDPAVKALYDPGNGLWKEPDSIPYPNGYEALQPNIRHIHIKDAVIEDGKTKAVRIGEGLVDYKGLISRLVTDGYDGYISLETHYRKNSEISHELLRLPGGHEFSNGAYEASYESMESLMDIINNV